MVLHIGTACLRGAGDTVSGLIAMIVINVVNVTISWASVLYFVEQPQLQWEGIALGTAAGYVVGGLIILLLLLRGRAGLKLRWSLLRPDYDLLRRILRVGIPGAFDSLSVILCQMWFVSIVNDLGTVAAAAHGIALKIEALSYLPGSAFQIAATTLSGQYLGAKDERSATRSVLMALAVGGGLMTIAGLAFFFIPEKLVAIFINAEQKEVAAAAAPLLRIIAFGTPTLAVMMVLSGALRGAGDTRWPLLVTLVGFLVFRIPTALLLTQYWHWGVEGAWFAMVVDITVRCLLVLYRFWHGGWKKTVV
jgi:putative MATE family efflux protein